MCFNMKRILFALLSLSLCGAASSLSCRWMDLRFMQISGHSLNLLDMMARGSLENSEDDEVKNPVAFPYGLYRQASSASAEDKLAFTVQVLTQTVALFEEDRSSASWDENTASNFLMDVTQQAEGLRSCIGSHGHKKKNKKLHMYFKALSNRVLKEMGHSAEAWELIRDQIQYHLMRVDLLLSPLRTRTN